MRRGVLLVAVGLLAVTSGCLGLVTDDEPRTEALDEAPEQEYAWDETRGDDAVDVHITVTEDPKFRAVYRLNGTDSVELYRRDGFGGRNPLDTRAMRFRYDNGSVINASGIDAAGGEITRTGDEVEVRPPEENGTLAFTADSTPKRFSLPVYVEGSHEFVLPADRRVDFFLFGSVSPSATERDRVDDRTVLRWDEITGRTLVVQYYLQRDLFIFAGVAGVSLLVGVGGVLYYRRLIERLRRQREELGLDVDTGDDEFGDDPPPGMG